MRKRGVSPEELRALALSLPGAEESSHFDQPDFRVRNRIFATLSLDRGLTWIKVSHDDMLALSQADPDTYEAQPWGKSSWVGVRLDRIDPGELRELVTEAWRGIAPRRLQAEFEG